MVHFRRRPFCGGHDSAMTTVKTAAEADGQKPPKKSESVGAYGRRRTRTWQRVVLFVLKRIGVALQTMPRERAMRWAERIGNLAHRVARRQRRYGTRNLRLTGFPRPDATPAECNDLLRRVFVHFAKTMVDLFRSPVTSEEEIDSLVRLDGWDNLERAYALGKGVICVSAHFGNWEIFARYVNSHGMPLTVIAREPEDPEFAAFLRSLRDAEGYRITNKGNAARDILKVLRKGEAVGMLPDQNSGDVFVPFFGLPTGTAAGPAMFALQTLAKVWMSSLAIGTSFTMPPREERKDADGFAP